VRLLCLIGLLAVASFCRAQDIRGADSIVPAISTDGGAVRMPEIRRRILVRADSLWARALRIHFNAIIMDGHADTPTRMLDDGYDIGSRHLSRQAHVDLPRMFEGGLDASFFSIYVPSSYGEGSRATARARAMIAEVKRQVVAHTDSAAMAYSAEDVRRITRAGKKAILMGLEGGHALAASPAVLRDLYDEGIRYVTLTHTRSNAWADASQSPPRWNGLNDLGRRMVKEMNRLGMLVDLSHTSDATFYDAIEASEAPVILSHSSTRALTDVVRNVDDKMLRALAENGGVVMINFYAPMVNRNLTPEVMAEVYRRLGGRQGDLRRLWEVVADVRNERGLGGGTLEDVLAHIDHAIRIAGIDHVALGSDFDGARMPHGLADVTHLPWITYGLRKRGYSETDLYKLLGGNTLRVMADAERTATHLRP